MARKLRIAASVFFGLLTVALCVLWLRSYWILDVIARRGPTYDVFFSNNGWLIWQRDHNPLPRDIYPFVFWEYTAVRPFEQMPRTMWINDKARTSFALWHSLLAAPLAAAALLPWARTRPRFSLRTLLIATTLVAVVLGFAVWAGR